jgi:nucleotide-binding universal stress UspA family protein
MMSYRKILVPIAGADGDEAVLRSAFGLAKKFGAHIEVLFVRPDPISAIPFGTIDVDPTGYSTELIIEATIKGADAAQQRARAAFDKIVEELGAPVVEKLSAKAEVNTSFCVVEGDFAERIERKSRLSDLIVFTSKSIDGTEATTRASFESALLSGARPVLFVPGGAADIPAQRVAIAFDGSATAAHAVSAALPFLQKAKELHALEVTSEKSSALSDLQDYLSLYGLSVTPHSIDPGLKSTAETLLTEAQRQHCDMIVQGGYGHSRLGEFVFGGVTRYVIKNGAPVAVLMTH